MIRSWRDKQELWRGFAYLGLLVIGLNAILIIQTQLWQLAIFKFLIISTWNRLRLNHIVSISGVFKFRLRNVLLTDGLLNILVRGRLVKYGLKFHFWTYDDRGYLNAQRKTRHKKIKRSSANKIGDLGDNNQNNVIRSLKSDF